MEGEFYSNYLLQGHKIILREVERYDNNNSYVWGSGGDSTTNQRGICVKQFADPLASFDNDMCRGQALGLKYRNHYTDEFCPLKTLCTDTNKTYNEFKCVCDPDNDICGDHGSCVNTANLDPSIYNKFECTCDEGYYGLRCDIPIPTNNCNNIKNQNKNNARCDSCSGAYTGRWCAISCDIDCNGGECSEYNGAAGCDCTDTGKVGARCESTVTCYNGGKVIPQMYAPWFTCDCPYGFQGPQCKTLQNILNKFNQLVIFNPCLNDHALRHISTTNEYISLGETTYTYSCDCSDVYTGHNCLGPCEIQNVQCENGFECIHYVPDDIEGNVVYPPNLDWMCDCNTIQNRISWTYPRLPVPDSIRIKDYEYMLQFRDPSEHANYITSFSSYDHKLKHSGRRCETAYNRLCYNGNVVDWNATVYVPLVLDFLSGTTTPAHFDVSCKVCEIGTVVIPAMNDYGIQSSGCISCPSPSASNHNRHYQDQVGQLECKVCPKGSKLVGVGGVELTFNSAWNTAAVDCVQCPSGTIEVAGIRCVACDLDTNNMTLIPNPDRTECVCPLGYTMVDGACEECPEGTSSYDTPNVCTPCPAGKSNGLDDTYAKLSSGYCADHYAEGHCIAVVDDALKCQPGESCCGGATTTSTLQECFDICSPIAPQDDNWNDYFIYNTNGKCYCGHSHEPSTCTSWTSAATSYDTYKISRRTMCATCPVGTYAFSGSPCKACLAGTYDHDSDPSTPCEACPEGQYQDTEGQTSCKPIVVSCPAGQFSGAPVRDVCQDCASNTFSAVGAKQCTQCENGLFAPEGSTECSSCLGLKGEYKHLSCCGQVEEVTSGTPDLSLSEEECAAYGQSKGYTLKYYGGPAADCPVVWRDNSQYGCDSFSTAAVNGGVPGGCHLVGTNLYYNAVPNNNPCSNTFKCIQKSSPFEEVTSGTPDLSLSEAECQAYAESIGVTYTLSDFDGCGTCPQGCFVNNDQGINTNVYYYTDERNVACGLSSPDGQRLCIQKTRCNELKTKFDTYCNTQCSSDGLNEYELCDPGFERSESGCQACPSGEYSYGGRCRPWTECAPDQESTGLSATDDVTCTDCPNGKYSVVDTYYTELVEIEGEENEDKWIIHWDYSSPSASGVQDCVEKCPTTYSSWATNGVGCRCSNSLYRSNGNIAVGTYGYGTGVYEKKYNAYNARTCVDCTPISSACGTGKQLKDACTSTSDVTCETCPAETFSDDYGACKPCTDCSALGQLNGGKVCNPTQDRTCRACEGISVYFNENGECHNCPAGKAKLASAVGTDPCNDCGAGFYADGITFYPFCAPCEGGKYQGQSAQSSCDDCPSGRYSESSHSGTTSCTGCPKGKYQDRTGQGSCKTCAYGKYTSYTGESSCSYCWSGSQPKNDKTGCYSCGAGKYGNRDDSAFCQSCPRGKFTQYNARSSCDECYWGEYQDYTGQTSCKSCPSGKDSCKGSTSSYACTPDQNFVSSNC